MAKAKIHDTKEFPTLRQYLDERGVYEKVSIAAEKLAISRQIQAEMRAQSVTKSQLAQSMGTSRAQLDRLLDPASKNVTIETLARAASVLGRRFHMELR